MGSKRTKKNSIKKKRKLKNIPLVEENKIEDIRDKSLSPYKRPCDINMTKLLDKEEIQTYMEDSNSKNIDYNTEKTSRDIVQINSNIAGSDYIDIDDNIKKTMTLNVKLKGSNVEGCDNMDIDGLSNTMSKLFDHYFSENQEVLVNRMIIEDLVSKTIEEYFNHKEKYYSRSDLKIWTEKCKELQAKQIKLYKLQYGLKKQLEDAKCIIKRLIDDRHMIQKEVHSGKFSQKSFKREVRSVGLQVCTVGEMSVGDHPYSNTTNKFNVYPICYRYKPILTKTKAKSELIRETANDVYAEEFDDNGNIRINQLQKSIKQKHYRDMTGENLVKENVIKNIKFRDYIKTDKELCLRSNFTALLLNKSNHSDIRIKSPGEINNEHFLKLVSASFQTECISLCPLPEYPASPYYPPFVEKPPTPIMRIEKKDVPKPGVLLSWSFKSIKQSEKIAEYQIYVHQERRSCGKSDNEWKLVGDMKALPLPMGCFLTQFRDGNNYFFIIRAIDNHKVMGDFCSPICISWSDLI